MSLNMRNLPMRRSTKRTWGLVFLMTVYVIVGAAIFYILENPMEQSERKELHRKRKAFLTSNICVTGLLHTVFIQIGAPSRTEAPPVFAPGKHIMSGK